AHRGVPHENQWTAAVRARDRAETTRPGILQGPLPVGLARRRRPEAGDGTESVLVGIDGEAVSRFAGEIMTDLKRLSHTAAGGTMTTSTIVARVEELIRRAEALEKGGASERSRAIVTRLRSTVLRPLAELGETTDGSTHRESQTAGLEELLFELAMALTRA